MNVTRRVFLDTMSAIRPIVSSPGVGQRWDEQSVLPDFSVRGLAGHLVRSALVVERYLDQAEPVDVEPISAAEYYANLDNNRASPLNVGVRERGEEMAAAGQARLIEALHKGAGSMEHRLSLESDDRLLPVVGGHVMRLDDYLPTRVVEMTVHADDLALSADLEPVLLPAAALDLAIEALVAVGRYRHGDLAVLRALCRRERDSVDALRIF